MAMMTVGEVGVAVPQVVMFMFVTVTRARWIAWSMAVFMVGVPAMVMFVFMFVGFMFVLMLVIFAEMQVDPEGHCCRRKNER